MHDGPRTNENHDCRVDRNKYQIQIPLPPKIDASVTMMQVEEKPDVTYQDVGGLDSQKQEIREAVELPLTHFDLYRKIGIDPPRGVLLYGPPGALSLASRPWYAYSHILMYRYRKDHARQGRRAPHDRCLHSCQRL